jgi:hypothetical protein
MRRALRTLLALTCLAPAPALADEVVPSAAVHTRVVCASGPRRRAASSGACAPASARSTSAPRPAGAASGSLTGRPGS